MSALVRAARPTDVADIVFLSSVTNGVSFSEVQAERACCVDDSTCQILVGVLGENLAGFIACDCVLDETTILAFAVEEKVRGMGLGGMLLHQALTQMRSVQSKRCLLEVASSNTVARQMYRAQGFVEDGLRKNYYGSGAEREDAVLMSLELQVKES